MKKILSLFLALALLLSLAGCFARQPSHMELVPPSTSSSVTDPSVSPDPSDPTEPAKSLDEDGFYYTKEDVALYIHLYGRLPDNFLTKTAAKNRFGSYSKAMQSGYRVGGDRFQNREGRLPAKPGRTFTECDIAAEGRTDRGAYRIVFSNDGLVWYTHDHYYTFELMYGEL